MHELVTLMGLFVKLSYRVTNLSMLQVFDDDDDDLINVYPSHLGQSTLGGLEKKHKNTVNYKIIKKYSKTTQ